MSLDINDLALQPLSRVWHPTCNRKGRRGRFLALEVQSKVQGFQACAASAPAGRAFIACFYIGFCCRGRNQNHVTRPFRRAGASPQSAPNLEEVSYEHSHSRYFAAGRRARISGLRANFVYPGSKPDSSHHPSHHPVHRHRHRQAAAAAACPRGFLGTREPIRPQDLRKAADRSYPRPRQRTR